MLNWFSKSQSLKNPEYLSKFIEDSFQNLHRSITNYQELYDFITEDICGASQGNEVAKQLVQFSGLFKVEYEDALHRTSTMDIENSALDLLNNHISPRLINELGLETAIKIRCDLVKRIITIHKKELDEVRLEIAKNKLATAEQHLDIKRNVNKWLEVVNYLRKGTNDTLIPQDLISLIPRSVLSPYAKNNFFLDSFKDIEKYFHHHKEVPNNIMMPILYAIRLSYAGMYAQGICTKEQFDQIDEGFFKRMAIIGSSISKDEQIEFQESSLEQALKWINHYYYELSKPVSTNLIIAAKKGLSLRDCLKEAINRHPVHYFTKNLNLDNLNPEFCRMFFTLGGWDLNQDKEDFIEKAYLFLNDPLLHPNLLLLRTDIELEF